MTKRLPKRRCSQCDKKIDRRNKSGMCMTHWSATDAFKEIANASLRRGKPTIRSTIPDELKPQYDRLCWRYYSASVRDHLLNGGELSPKPTKPRKTAKGTPDARLVVKAVADLMQVCAKDIAGQSQFRMHLEARAVAFVVLRSRKYSMSGIGRAFGKDHSTVRNAILRFPEMMERNPLLSVAVRKAMQVAA